jgi:uncharacterized repeat protein (TIGR03803 family)
MLKINPLKAVFVLCPICLMTALVASPQATFTTIYSFCSQTNCTDGAAPYAGLAQGTDGRLYGTTETGGANGSGGTVFKIRTDGGLITLYSFCEPDDCSQNGYIPFGGLVLATNGNFYGTTEEGGIYNGGTVFKISSNGALTTLYSFCAKTNCMDGNSPVADPVQATNGDLYGVTEVGGANLGNGGSTCLSAGFIQAGCGTIFKITPGGALTTLYSFCPQSSCPDGFFPRAALIQAANGDLYGGTSYGGGSCVSGQGDCGTIFRITPEGALTTLYSFCALATCADGGGPSALVQATDGNFYGTTTAGGRPAYECPPSGADYGCGTVFKLTPGGVLTTLYSFCAQSNCADGAFPGYGGAGAGLVLGSDGNFYGTTSVGGANNLGTIFEITPRGRLTTLYNFCSQTNCTDGAYPTSGLLQATNGNFYGTTESDGANNDGTIFSLSVRLGPFVETNPTSGKVGTTVTILGNNLTGSTSVTFNGTSGAFTVKSGTEITTTVPSGATTGNVQVTTPSGVLTSNVKFRVP